MRDRGRTLRRRGALVAAAALAAVALTACSGGPSQDAIDAQAYTDETLNDPIEPVGPGGSLEVEAYEFGFNLVGGVAIDGPVEVTLDNIGGTQHNFRIDAAAGENKKVEAAGGESNTGTLKLFGPGEYTYYCDIPGHRAQGMEGTLVVYATPEEAEQAQAQGEGSSEG